MASESVVRELETGMIDLAKFGITRRSLLKGTGAFAAGISLLPRSALAAEEPVVNFLNWENYIGDTTFSDFQANSGVAVKFTAFQNSLEMLDAIRQPNHGYDVIVPSNDYVELMIHDDLLMPLDKSILKNLNNIQRQFRDAEFDPGRKYSIGYVWGTLGIGYRHSAVDEPPGSWRWLFESNKFNGRIALMEESTAVLGCALRYLGLPVNTTDAGHIKTVERLLIRQKPNIKVFAPDNGEDLLINDEVDLALVWSSDMQRPMATHSDLDYIIPREGSILWQDSLCIPKGAPNPMNAHKFIDFILEAKNGVKIAKTLGTAVANAAAKRLMPRSYRDNPVIFPSDIILASCKVLDYKGPEVEAMYNAAWERIQAA
jgi:spermidine/putrescine transport system substrate-binding protein